MALHYTNDSCPFSHRAMFARALRPPADTKVQYVPYGRQVEFAERLGMQAIQGATKSFEGMTVEELKLLDHWFCWVGSATPTPSCTAARGIMVSSFRHLRAFCCDLFMWVSNHLADLVQQHRSRQVLFPEEGKENRCKVGLNSAMFPGCWRMTTKNPSIQVGKFLALRLQMETWQMIYCRLSHVAHWPKTWFKSQGVG